MGVDYVVIGFDVEVQPLVTHTAAWPLCVSAICIANFNDVTKSIKNVVSNFTRAMWEA